MPRPPIISTTRMPGRACDMALNRPSDVVLASPTSAAWPELAATQGAKRRRFVAKSQVLAWFKSGKRLALNPSKGGFTSKPVTRPIEPFPACERSRLSLPKTVTCLRRPQDQMRSLLRAIGKPRGWAAPGGLDGAGRRSNAELGGDLLERFTTPNTLERRKRIAPKA